jgi:glycosyltransferase involved in cell wall biosynthesis
LTDEGCVLPPAITINGRFMTRPTTGVERFAVELLRAWLPTHDRGRSATLALPSQTGEETASRQAQRLGIGVGGTVGGSLQGHAWEQLQLPGLSKGSVLVNLCNSAPLACRRQIVVVHDAAVVAMPGSYSFAYRNWYRWITHQLVHRAAVVATVSEFSAGEIRRCFGRFKNDIAVIHESGEHVLRETADTRILERLGLAGRRFVLTVGSRSPTKNLGAVIKAAALLRDLDIEVVAAGGANSRVFNAAGAATDGVLGTGRVSNGELRALYENAECFVFPSLYEGFGLPPLEAMHCGCPVIVSRRASLPEVCGDAALYFDPDDPAEIAQQIRRVVGSAALRAEMREAGHQRVRRFSWGKAATQFEEVFSQHFPAAAA